MSVWRINGIWRIYVWKNIKRMKLRNGARNLFCKIWRCKVAGFFVWHAEIEWSCAFFGGGRFCMNVMLRMDVICAYVPWCVLHDDSATTRVNRGRENQLDSIKPLQFLHRKRLNCVIFTWSHRLRHGASHFGNTAPSQRRSWGLLTATQLLACLPRRRVGRDWCM
jgi:hypothetical protein